MLITMFMRVIGLTIKQMELDYTLIQMVQFTKENGVMTNNKVLVLKLGQMEQDTKDNIKEDKKMVLKKNN